MSFKTKWITLISLIAVLLLILIIVPFFDSASRVERSLSKAIFGNFKKSLTETVIISKGEEEAIIAKNDDDTWMIDFDGNQIAADSKKVEDLLSAAKELSIGRLVSKNDKDLDQYGLSEDNLTRIKLVDSKDRSYILNIGDQDSSYQYNYVNVEGETSVYETKINSLLTQTKAKEWAILKLFSSIEQQDSVIKIEVTGNDPFKDEKVRELNYQLIKIENETGELEWTMDNVDQKVVQYEVNNIARKVSSAQAYDFDFTASSKQTGLDTPTTLINITSTQGNIITMLIGNKVAAENRFYVTMKNSDFVYQVSKSTLTGLLKSKMDILKTH